MPAPTHSFTIRSDKILRILATKAKVSPAFDPLAREVHPSFCEFAAVWDTGSTGSVISQKVVEACGLQPIGMTKAQTAGGERNCEVYLINLMLPNGVGFPRIHVTRMDLGPRTDLLIGMDIITRGDLALTHRDGKTCFTFQCPSSEEIDFTRSWHC
jgi:hypothetical protein